MSKLISLTVEKYDIQSEWSQYAKYLKDGYTVKAITPKKVVHESVSYEILLEKP